MEYKIYNVKDYSLRSENFEEKSYTTDNIKDIVKSLNEMKYYHMRIKKGEKYVFYMDLDGYDKDINIFFQKFIDFLNNYHDICIKEKHIKYTINTGSKMGSYHISIPKLNCTTETNKTIVSQFRELENISSSVLDTSVYSDKWFRMPNQLKGKNKNKPTEDNSIHKIERGKMEDFVLNHITPDSHFIEVKKIDNFIEKNIIKNDNQDIEQIIKLLNILPNKYYDEYNYWNDIKMILKKYEKNTGHSMIDIFNSFSSKSKKYTNETKEQIKQDWEYLDTYDIRLNINSLFYYARNENLREYKEICKHRISKGKFEITEKYLAEKIKELAGEIFIYKNKILYTFDVKYKFWHINQPEIIKRFINDELYDHLKTHYIEFIEDSRIRDSCEKSLKHYCCTNKGQENIFSTFYNRYFDECSEIEFDQKYYLVGFNNGVYDLQENKFRDYKYNDYMTTKTGYNYRKPTEREITEIYECLNKIELDKEKKNFLLKVLSTGIIGKSYQKFLILSGCGSNGKTTIEMLMEFTLGNYYYKGKTVTLCSDVGVGANPEISKMDMKRYIVFTEPEKSQKIKNGTLKSLTGDNIINARALFSNNTETHMVGTIALLCNDKIYLEADPTNAEVRRMIDYTFESRFDEDKNTKDDYENKVFKANPKYIEPEYLKTLKYAFLDILLTNAHEFITKDNELLDIPQRIKDKTEEYLNNCNFLITVLKENTTQTNNDTDILSINDLFTFVKSGDYYSTLGHTEKRKITKKAMIEFYSTFKSTRKAYKDRAFIDKTNYRNILLGYKLNNDILEDDIID